MKSYTFRELLYLLQKFGVVIELTKYNLFYIPRKDFVNYRIYSKLFYFLFDDGTIY